MVFEHALDMPGPHNGHNLLTGGLIDGRHQKLVSLIDEGFFHLRQSLSKSLHHLGDIVFVFEFFKVIFGQFLTTEDTFTQTAKNFEFVPKG